jgi:hypothetical protein
MTSQQGNCSPSWVADVECADHLVDAGGCDDGAAVFIPVMCESFGWWVGSLGISSEGGTWHWCGAMNGDQVYQVVGRRCGCT